MRYFIFILSLLISVATLGQQATYTRIYSGSSYDEGIAAFRLPNKEIRLIGNTGSFGHGNTDVWLITLDSIGNFLWHKFYGGTNIERVEDAVMTSNGNIFMVGSTTQNTAASYQIYFLGVDPYGQIIAYNNYGGKDRELGHGIALITDSTFVLTGESYSYGNGQSDIYLLKLNQNGDTLWTKTYGGVSEERGNAIKLMPDNGFIVVGATKSFGNGTFDSYLIRLNPNGDTLWTKVRSHISDAEYYSMTININTDTSIVCVGYQNDTLNAYRDVDIVSYDQYSNFIWSRANSLTEGEECYINSIFTDDNGEYIYCGITNKYSASQYSNIRLARLSSLGWWQSSVSIGEEKEEVPNAVSPDNFNGKHYFLIGTTKSYGVERSGVFFVRLDSNFNYDTTGMLETPTLISQYEQNQLIKVFPNPARDYLNIDFSDINENGVLQIVNMLGEIIITDNIAANTRRLKLPIANLEIGAYVLRFQSPKFLFQQQFVRMK